MASFLKRLFGSQTNAATLATATPSINSTNPEMLSAKAIETQPMAVPATLAEPATRVHEIPMPESTIVPQVSASTRSVSDETMAELLRRKLVAMQAESAEQLKDWTCTKCGAALPREVTNCGTLSCTYCGSVFSTPRPRKFSGGVNISGETITVGGDIIGGDRIVIASKSQTESSDSTDH